MGPVVADPGWCVTDLLVELVSVDWPQQQPDRGSDFEAVDRRGIIRR
jgi:hypothetical protein